MLILYRPTRTVDMSSEYDNLLFAGHGILHLQKSLTDAFHKGIIPSSPPPHFVFAADCLFELASPTACTLPLVLVAFSKGMLHCAST